MPPPRQAEPRTDVHRCQLRRPAHGNKHPNLRNIRNNAAVDPGMCLQRDALLWRVALQGALMHTVDSLVVGLEQMEHMIADSMKSNVRGLLAMGDPISGAFTVRPSFRQRILASCGPDHRCLRMRGTCDDSPHGERPPVCMPQTMRGVPEEPSAKHPSRKKPSRPKCAPSQKEAAMAVAQRTSSHNNNRNTKDPRPKCRAMRLGETKPRPQTTTGQAD